MSTVSTVRGLVEVDELGQALMHEHIVNINAEISRDQPELSWGGDRQLALEAIASKLRDVKAAGIDTIVDATAIGHGRDIAALREINAMVDLNIIVSTGIYTYDDLPFYFQYRAPADASARDVMTEIFVRDIRDGIAGTDVRAAIIKVATDLKGVTPNIERILRAAARAHRETGAPITTHTQVSERNGLDQQRIFKEEGVDLTRVIIGHSGDSTDLDYLRELMDAGSMIGADRFGLYMAPHFPSFEERIETLVRLIEAGYGDRIVLSHDYTAHSDWFLENPLPVASEWSFTHVSSAVIPALRERGVTEEQIDALLVHNPRRVFAAQGAY
ncbi:phosphotriesterase family protein [Conexibacter stalactiti]